MKVIKALFKTFLVSLLLALVACTNPIAESGGIDSAMRSAKNSEYLTFTIDADEVIGTVTPSVEMTCKIENTYDISFTESREYQFIKWEVYNSKKGKIVNDVIKFDDASEPETKITILKYAENIVLRPVCAKRPAIASQIPSFMDEGVYSDSIIVISFDKQISPDSFRYTPEEIFLLEADSFIYDDEGYAYGYTLNGELYYKNVKISSNLDENLLSYFYPPVIENGYIVKIMPRLETPLITTEGSLLDIDVFLSPEIVDTNYISVGGEGAQWRYRINSKTDTEPPVFESFALATLFTKLKSQFADDLLVEGSEFTPRNHLKNKVCYTCSGSDNGCGVNFMQVSAQRIATPDGTLVEEDPVVELVSNNHFTADDNNVEYATGYVELKNPDGLLKLTFTLFDYSGNQSAEEKTYYVVKDTFVDVSSVNIYNRQIFTTEDSVTQQNLNESVQKICWTNVPDDVWFETEKTNSDDLKYILYWGNQKGNLTQKAECSKRENFADGVWSFVIPPFDATKETYLRLEIKDSLDNAGYVDAVIPATPKYFTYQKLSEYGDVTYVDPQTGVEESLEYPAHYRIFYSLSDISYGQLYYSYDGSDELQTQQFLNIQYDFETNTPYLPECKYSDLYVNDISKCTFYFQSVLKGEQRIDDSETVFAENVVPNKTQEQLLEEMTAYNPELKAVYIWLCAQENFEEAENLLNAFNSWSYINSHELTNRYSSYLISATTSFVINEKKTVKAPVVESIFVERGEINSGVNIATVQFTTNPPSDAVFNIFWGTSEDNITNFETEETFDIPSGITTLYYQTVYVDTFLGDSKIGDVCSYDLSAFDFDTVPPKVQDLRILNENCYYPEIIFDIYYDDYLLKDGLAEYRLYTIPLENRFVTLDQLSDEEIQKAICLTQRFTPAVVQGDFVTETNKFEYFDYADNFFCLIYLEDVSGNFSYYPLKIVKSLLLNRPEIKVVQNVDEEDLVDIIFNIEKEENCSDYQIAYSTFNSQFVPEQFDEVTTISEKQKSTEDVIIESEKESASITVTNQKDLFVQAFSKALYKEEKEITPKYSNPVYFYAGVEEEISCELKDLIDGLNGAQIYCDRPCLVMTYWSSENYEYSIDAWETYGVQCNPVFISAKNEETGNFEETMQYYKLNYDQIPMGKFFVVIAHFADGTALMSKKINTN